MGRYILRRTGQSLLVLLAVSLIVFLILHASGDPIQILMPAEATQEQVEKMRSTLGLDRPLWVQYGRFLWNAAQGDLGISFRHGQPAARLVLERLPASAQLVVVAFTLSFLISIPLGVLAAAHRGSLFERVTLVGSLVGISAPHFWVGIILILVFCVELQWLPSSGRGTWAHLVLPAGSLAFYRLALFIRLLRAGMLDVLTQDYIRTARAKGLAESRVIYLHALRNTLIPFVTVAGLQMGAVLAGAIVTEHIFAWPGMGRLFLEAIGHMDFPVIIAWALITSTIFLVVNFLVDMVYVFLDPRIRHD
jgi:ABC-type dipeptide/oligopeptide/nickel transport system permease component